MASYMVRGNEERSERMRLKMSIRGILLEMGLLGHSLKHMMSLNPKPAKYLSLFVSPVEIIKTKGTQSFFNKSRLTYGLKYED